jgi:hypothetical protein
MDAGNLLVLVLLASFAIDRTSHAIVYAFSLTGALKDPPNKDASSDSSSKRSTVLYFIVASVLSILFLVFWEPLPIQGLLLSTKLGTGATSFLERLFTFIVLVGGSDGISTVLDSSFKKSAPVSRTSEALVVEGDVTVKEGPKV